MNINEIINIISWALIITGVIFLIWRLIGGSPSELNILIVLVSGTLFKVITMGNNLAGLREKASGIEQRLVSLENRFSSLVSDFKEHIKHK